MVRLTAITPATAATAITSASASLPVVSTNCFSRTVASMRRRSRSIAAVSKSSASAAAFICAVIWSVSALASPFNSRAASATSRA